jgi:hypothetical protein
MPRAKKAGAVPTEYQLLTHKGRQIDESKSPDYCGSCTIELHIAQMEDKSSWVQGFLDQWYELGGGVPDEPKKTAVLFTEERQAARAADKALIAQFAVGLLRDGTGSYDADDVALRNRTKDALNRARVMLEEFKKFEV